MQPTNTIPAPADHRMRRTALRLAPYGVMLVLAEIAVAWTDVRPDTSVTFWRLCGLVYAVIALYRVWSAGPPDRLRNTFVQLAHWGVFLVAMVLVDFHYFSGEFNDDNKGLMLLLLLALATFLDGLYIDWRFCVVGTLLGLGATLLAFVDEAAVAISLAGLGALVVLVLIHLATERHRRSASGL